jgi:HSP20 family protein
VKADDVNVEVNENVLSISGSRAAEETGQTQLVERPYGSFVRTLTLPQGVDSESIEAGYQDGVLELHIPKPAEQKPKKISIGATGKKAIEK